MIVVGLLFLSLIAIVGFAYLKGDQAERLGGLWLLLNVAVQWLVTTFFDNDPTLHVVIDGVYATGLLPLAFWFVSWWIGIQTFVAAAGFSLEAYYLLTDRPIDYAFLALSNWLFAAGLLNLLLATSATCWFRNHPPRSVWAKFAAT